MIITVVVVVVVVELQAKYLQKLVSTRAVSKISRIAVSKSTSRKFLLHHFI